MKNLITFLAIAFYAAIISGCGKNSDYTPGYDHTSGMIKTWYWSGIADGNYYYDSVRYDSPSHDSIRIKWPKPYSRVITDTPIPVVKINDFAVSVMGTLLRYRSTDSTTYHTVKYDTTMPNSPISPLVYYFLKDSMTYEYHQIFEYHNPTGLYYQTNFTLHSVHH